GGGGGGGGGDRGGGGGARAGHPGRGGVMGAAGSNALREDHCFRLIGQLWAMKRMYYYVYGAWGSSLTINQYPPSVDYLFAKQVYDESTHEMLYSQAILQKGWVKFQRL